MLKAKRIARRPESLTKRWRSVEKRKEEDERGVMAFKCCAR
jgi:hypothetical protein